MGTSPLRSTILNLKQRNLKTPEEKALEMRKFRAKWIGCIIASIIAVLLLHHFYPQQWVGHSIAGVTVLFGFCLLAPTRIIEAIWNSYLSLAGWFPGAVNRTGRN